MKKTRKELVEMFFEKGLFPDPDFLDFMEIIDDAEMIMIENGETGMIEVYGSVNLADLLGLKKNDK